MFSTLAFDPSAFSPAAFSGDDAPPLPGSAEAFSTLAFDPSAFSAAAFASGAAAPPVPDISYAAARRKVLLLEIGAGNLPAVTAAVRLASPWFPVPFTPPPLDPPTGLVADATLAGLRISWDAVADPKLTYQLERAPDVAGAPGTWAIVYRGDHRPYITLETAATWWRVSTTLRGLAGAASAAISASPSATTLFQQARIFLYKRSASSPDLPSVDVTYTFATGDTAGVDGGWSSIPATADGNPLWATVATALSATTTDVIAPGEWASPVVMALDGGAGGAGADGLNNATVFLFKRDASTPAVPSTTSTYTFATSVLSGHDNGWTQDVPAANGNPLYVIAATASSASSTDTIATGEWAAPVIQAQDGTNGLNAATVYLFQRAADAPAVPSATLTWTFSTAVLSGGSLASWSQTAPVNDGNPLWVTMATALSTGANDTIATGEWATPVIQAQDGTNGLNAATVYLFQRAASAPDVPSATLTWTFATAALSGGSLASWSQTAPTHDGNPLWVTTATALSSGTTDTIATGEWATPQVIAQNGTNGSNGSNGTTALNLSATNSSKAVRCDYTGAPLSGELPYYATFAAFFGSTDVTASASYSNSVSGCTVTDHGGGSYEVTAVAADTGYCEVTASYGGATQKLRFTFAKVYGGAPGNSVSDGSLAVNSTTSYSGTQGGPLTLAVGPGGTISVGVAQGYVCANGSPGFLQLVGKFQYRTTPGAGAWTDVGVGATGSMAVYPSTPGAIVIGETLAGPGVTTLYEFQYLNYNNISGQAGTAAGGSFGVSWSP